MSALRGMSHSQMALWTWQTQGFRIDRDRVCWQRSRYLKQCPELWPKYLAVRDRLGTDQFLWLFTVRCDWSANTVDTPRRCLWELSVPTSAVALFVDERLAGRLVRKQPCTDPHTWRAWREEARQASGPHGSGKREDFFAQKLADYDKLGTCQEPEWGRMFIDAEAAEDVSAVLTCPVPPAWITDTPA